MLENNLIKQYGIWVNSENVSHYRLGVSSTQQESTFLGLSAAPCCITEPAEINGRQHLSTT
jgi:hypothetical protein